MGKDVLEDLNLPFALYIQKEDGTTDFLIEVNEIRKFISNYVKNQKNLKLKVKSDDKGRIRGYNPEE